MANNSQESHPKPLFEDHRRDGKTFVPPAVDRGWQAMDFPDTILPELIWIGFLQDRWGNRRGAQLAVQLIKTALEMWVDEFKPEFGFASMHRMLSAAHRNAIRERLQNCGTLTNFQEALGPFLQCYPENNPLKYLVDCHRSDFASNDIDCAKRVIDPRINRWSKEGTAMQAVIVLGELASGRLTLPQGDGPPMNFEAIFDDPESPSAKESAGFLRAMLSGTYAFHRTHLDPAWSKYFWNRGYSLEPIHDRLQLPPSPSADDHVLIRFRLDFARLCISKLREIATPVILAAKTEEEHAVVNGLLARQVTLATAVIDNFEVWNWEIGPLYLRALTDCHITLAWILGDVPKRARDYVIAGLGQEKLQIGHKERELEKMTDPDERTEYQGLIRILKRWVESQKFLFWIPVNVGAWSGKNTRQMAEEAGCLDLYNHAYLGSSGFLVARIGVPGAA